MRVSIIAGVKVRHFIGSKIIKLGKILDFKY